MEGNASLIIQTGGALDVGNNMDIIDDVTFEIQSGTTVDIGNDFTNDSPNVVIDGTMDIVNDFDNQSNGQLTGAGVITYGSNCSSDGTVVGETGSTVFDGSGAINLGTLPIELLYFKAKAINDQVLLTWATASEENFDFFTIQRSSNALDFSSIGTLPGNGFSTQRIDYSFKDMEPLAGRSFYRLKATDFDGSFEYFIMVSVVFEKRLGKVYPNPLRGQNLKLLMTLEQEEVANIRLNNLLGQQIYQGTVNNGINELALKPLSAGTYLLAIETLTSRQQVKLLVN